MAKALVLLVLSLSCLTVFCEDLDQILPSMPPHYGGMHHPPAGAPVPHHHHPHPHIHPPTPSPVHPPSAVPAYPPEHHHHHHPHPHPHPPAHTPVQPPVHPPAMPPTGHHYPHPPTPTPAPVKPPVHRPTLPPKGHFPRSFVAVQGVVYVKSCKYAGVDTLLGASPVSGAFVKLQCNNTKYPLVAKAITDKNGYFYLQAPKTITTYGAHKCKAFLVSAQNATVSKPSNLHYGVMGAPLKPEKPFLYNKMPFLLYTVGPFAFEPMCPKH